MQRALEREEHDSGRLRWRASLEPVQALRRALVVWIAADAVDGVGREHGDAAAGDAFAPAPCVRAVEARGRCHRRRPVTTRSIPARSGVYSTSAKPAAATSS